MNQGWAAANSFADTKSALLEDLDAFVLLHRELMFKYPPASASHVSHTVFSAMVHNAIVRKHQHHAREYCVRRLS